MLWGLPLQLNFLTHTFREIKYLPIRVNVKGCNFEISVDFLNSGLSPFQYTSLNTYSVLQRLAAFWEAKS